MRLGGATCLHQPRLSTVQPAARRRPDTVHSLWPNPKQLALPGSAKGQSPPPRGWALLRSTAVGDLCSGHSQRIGEFLGFVGPLSTPSYRVVHHMWIPLIAHTP
jgi:hypothetical protein